jgi:predicted nucleotidyltransferase
MLLMMIIIGGLRSRRLQQVKRCESAAEHEPPGIPKTESQGLWILRQWVSLRGRDKTTMEQIGQILQIILSHHPNVQAVYLFGSYATKDERQDSDVDIALLLSPDESRSAGSLQASEQCLELEHLLHKNVDLINLRRVSTVLQKEVISADRRIHEGDKYAAEEFEMLTLSQYQKLNEERAGIVESALGGGRFHEV